VIEFIVIYKVKTYLPDSFTHSEITSAHAEFENLRDVERFVNLLLKRNRWMKPSDFRVYSCRRANLIQSGQPVEDSLFDRMMSN
jgi:hypothetical protein